MQRRALLSGGLAAAALHALPASTLAATARAQPLATPGRFKLKYAPHFGMFREHAGKDLVDQLKFMADEGFSALEDNRMPSRSEADQERVGQALRDLKMTMGVFVAHADAGRPTFASSNAELWAGVEKQLHEAVEVGKRVGATWCTIVPGSFDRLDHLDFQQARVIDNLRRAADILEPGGLIGVLEPLNPYRDHPGCFLTRVPQAYALCRAVNRPGIKILDDLYHQQITEGNLIPNLDRAWSEIAYFQVGDNPGRKEPTTGEINYRNIFRHLHAKGWQGVIGMEHGNSKPGKTGERAVIDAYLAVDDFE